MPLLDAALAFALTMLAISSLVGLILDSVYRFSQVRTRRLEKMVVRFFEESVLPALEQKLEAKAEGAVDASRAELLEMVARLKKERARPAPAGPRPGEDPGAARWLGDLNAGQLISEVSSQQLVSLSAEQIRQWVAESPAGQRIRAALKDKADDLFDELQRPWDELGQAFSDSFRSHSRTWATGIALALAFGLNIDSLFLLDTYMTDDEARAAVIAQQAEIVADVHAGGPRLGDADPSWDPEAAFRQIQNEIRSFESNRFAVGWDLFPNCPPTSTDWRCADYWQRVVESDDYTRLTYGQRRQLNPLAHPSTAFLSASAPADRPGGEPPSTVDHTATTGGPAGGRAAGAAGDEDLPASYHGKLGGRALFGWVFGCILTGLLAGVGSPFWYEVVQKLGLIRLGWYKERQKNQPVVPLGRDPSTADTGGADTDDAANPGGGKPS